MLKATLHRPPVPLRRRHLNMVALLGTWLFFLVANGLAQCSNPANPIVAENCLPGNPASEWDVGSGNNGDLTIQGFATDISVNRGGTVYFKINTPASAYTIDIYRIGYYGGNGARKVASLTPSAALPQTQPPCATDTTTGLIDCGTWAVSASWQVPATATSGVYFAHLTRKDTGGDSHIVFLVRNDASNSAIMYQTSDESWQAYNYYGAGSFYSQAKPLFDLTDRSYKVSYNRPFLTRGFNQEWDTWIFGAEFAMIQWLESNGYDVTYFSGIDADRNGSLIKNHKIYMDSGHDEYWTGQQRANVQAARDAGVNLAFFSGNTMFWKTRWENSIDGANTPNRTLVCYKETLAFAKIDQQHPTIWTGTFRDSSFSPPADAGIPENSLTGTLFMVNGTGPDNDGSLQIKVPAADGKMRFWRNTAAATLAPTATYSLPKATLGYEWDLDVDNGFRPAGAFDVSTSTYTLTSDYLLDAGATYGAGTATHHMMLYRAASGALVFSSGTIDWSWGLNSNHDNLFGFASPAPDLAMQQATVNLLADMGAQPATAQPGIVQATRSSDTTAPVSTIAFPTATTTLTTGTPISVTGTASDSGGMVAGVELSTDGGTTWHPAVGRSTWSYLWTPSKVGTTTLLSRAVDDSANLETPGSGVTVSLQSQVCPCTIWTPSAIPATADSGDATAIEVGLKFRADADGTILGLRFYKSALNTGTHIGHIWSASGTLLGTATFSGESSAGWQQANFSAPVAINANTTYVVSYYAPQGHYARDAYFFQQSGVDDPPLHALANGVDGGDGVFLYPPSKTLGGFPSSSNGSANFWVDLVYTSSNTYTISGSISGTGGAGSSVSLSGAETAMTTTDSFGRYSFSGVVNGTYTVTPTNTGVNFTPASQTTTVNGASVSALNFAAVVANPLSISGTVSNTVGATVTLGGGASSSALTDPTGYYSFGGLLNGSYTVTPVESGYLFAPGTQSISVSGSSVANVNFQGQVCNCVSIWQPSAVPSLIDSADASPIEVGVKFRADVSGVITALRFYKASSNVGTHLGHIWTSTGTLLGSATFANETASGWQQVSFSTPVQVTANTTYIASYYAPSGHYSADTNAFATSGVDSTPLHALANGKDGPDGVYLYTSSPTGGFPNNTYGSTNYWVDVLFAGAQTLHLSGTVVGAPGATVLLAGGSGASTVADGAGNYSFNVYAGTYMVTPSLAQFVFLPATQTVSVSSADVTQVNFSVPAVCPCDTIWSPASQPATIDSHDTQPYELGVKFRADRDGYILGVRFYKAATQTGTHLGHLWSLTGSGPPLAAATFLNESASGWQQVIFASPVAVLANTTYVASYFAPEGHYSVDSSAFTTTGVDAVPLHALASGVDGPNGVYLKSALSALPTASYHDSNYWVDVIYANASTHTIGGTISGTGGAGATIMLSGASTTATATADASGRYSFSGLADGTYTLTPASANYTFSPASATVVLSGAHSLGNNFVASITGFSVSGTVVGGPQIDVAIAGAGDNSTVTTDTSGNFSFPSVPNGTYTITPSGAGYGVAPASQNISVNGASVSGVNFTATALTYSISGTISGGAGAIVALTGTANASTTADAFGNYSFTVTNGAYVVTPAQTGVVFTPANLGVTVTGASIPSANFWVPATCPCDTLWQATSVPGTIDDHDNGSIEVGVKFRSDSAGLITGIRFYKAAANTGVHQGNLWSSTGTLLASATFVGESSSGWQQVFFNTPVLIAANTTYVASYFAPSGHYAGDAAFFASAGFDSPPLHALREGQDGSNGVFIYATSSAFPTQSYKSGNYWVDIIFEPTYTLSGSIGGSGQAGTTLTIAGPLTQVATADGSGNYNSNALVAGRYTVTPSNPGVLFTPSSQATTITNANLTLPAFTAAAQTFTLTGVISGPGGNGATVSLTGASTATTTATSAGSYGFAGLANGVYTVAPSKSGATFTPSSQTLTISGANLTANFSSTVPTSTISGTISGTGGKSTTVTLSGASTATTTNNTSGTYSFPGLISGSYTVTPTKSGYAFSPTAQLVSLSGTNVTANFSSTAVPTYTISGTISGAGGKTTTVALGGALSATTTTSVSGTYSFSGLANGSYSVTPTKPGYVFSPASQAVNVNGASLTANFTSAALTYTVSGVISNAGGSGATVNLRGAANATTTASSSGACTLTGVANGSYTDTPVKAGYLFTPTSQAIVVNGANAIANFTSSLQTFTISGVMTGAGSNGATVTLGGTSTATATANPSGAYSFSGLSNGTYVVSPVETGYAFSPVSRSVTVSGGNKTANFTSTLVSISGTLSGPAGPGATVTLSGASNAIVTASSSGAYTFQGLANGTYTVTPTHAGYSFTVPSQTVTVNGASKTLNFSTTLFTISGTITGVSGSGATVQLSGGATATVIANTSGVYRFTGVANGAYTVTPSKSSGVFNPASRTVTVNQGNVTANFIGTP